MNTPNAPDANTLTARLSTWRIDYVCNNTNSSWIICADSLQDCLAILAFHCENAKRKGFELKVTSVEDLHVMGLFCEDRLPF